MFNNILGDNDGERLCLLRYVLRLSRSRIVLKRQKISTRFLSYTIAPCLPRSF